MATAHLAELTISKNFTSNWEGAICGSGHCGFITGCNSHAHILHCLRLRNLYSWMKKGKWVRYILVPMQNKSGGDRDTCALGGSC